MNRVSVGIAAALLVAGCGAKPTITPTARSATVGATIDGVVYIAGGVERGPSGSTTTARVEAFDPDDGTWVQCAPMSTPRAFAAAAASGGKLYVFGGLGADGAALPTAEVYDPSIDAWTACPSMATPRSRAAAVNHGDRGILVVGGMDEDQKDLRSIDYFSVDENVWRTWQHLRSARHGHALADSVADRERIFSIGGYGDDAPSVNVDVWGVGPAYATDEEFEARLKQTVTSDGKVVVPNRNDLGYAWRPAPALGTPRGFFGLATIGTRIYVVGGRCRDIPPTEVLDMDETLQGWSTAAPLPKDLCRFTLVEWDGRLLAFGGETEFGAAINTDVLEYDPDADAWTVRSPR